MPIASVSAYVGGNIPYGWLLCDGRSLKDTPDYHDLFAHPIYGIGTSHGAGYDNNNLKTGDFNLPDYRGYFLRGADPAGHSDLDVTTRTFPKPGGNTQSQIGSVQLDDFKSHDHPVTVINDSSIAFISVPVTPGLGFPTGLSEGVAFSDGGQSGIDRKALGVTVTVNNYGGKETRPRTPM